MCTISDFVSTFVCKELVDDRSRANNECLIYTFDFGICFFFFIILIASHSLAHPQLLLISIPIPTPDPTSSSKISPFFIRISSLFHILLTLIVHLMKSLFVPRVLATTKFFPGIFYSFGFCTWQKLYRH